MSERKPKRPKRPESPVEGVCSLLLWRFDDLIPEARPLHQAYTILDISYAQRVENRGWYESFRPTMIDSERKDVR